MHEFNGRPELSWQDPEFAAVAEHFKTFHGFDGVILNQIQSNNANFTGKQIRKIANVYFVTRGIKKRPDKCCRDVHAQWIASELSNLGVTSEEELLNKFRKCQDIAERASRSDTGDKEDIHTNGFQISAMTKFMWFKQPLNWTPFDDTAASGLGINKKPPRKRSVDFYNKLRDIKFTNHVEKIRNELTQTPHEHLFAERIIDKFLMLKCVEENQGDVLFGDTYEFVQLLPNDCRSKLEKTAKRIAPCLKRFENQAAG